MAGRRDSIFSSESVDLPDPNMSPSNGNYQSNYSSIYGSNIEGERGYYTSVGPPSSMNTTFQRSTFGPMSSTADSTLQGLKNELEKLREDKRECEAQLKYANSEKDLMKSHMDQLKARANAQARIPQHLLVYIEKLKITLAEKDRETEKIQVDSCEKSKTLGRLGDEIDRLNRECSELKFKQQRELEDVTERLNKELQSLRKQLSDSEDAKLKLGEKLKSEQEKFAESEYFVNQISSQMSALEEENKSLEDQLRRARESFSRYPEKQKLEKDLEKAKVDTNRLAEDNSRLQSKIKELEETIQEHSNQLEAKTGVLNEVDRLRQENYELANKLQKLEKSQQLIKVSDRPKTNHNDIEDHFKKLLNLTESLENHLKTSDVARGDTRSKPEQASAGIGRHLQVALSDTVNDQLSEGRKLVRRLRNEIASLKGQIQNEENDQKSLMNDAIKERPGVPTSSSQDQSLRNNPVKYSQEEIRVGEQENILFEFLLWEEDKRKKTFEPKQIQFISKSGFSLVAHLKLRYLSSQHKYNVIFEFTDSIKDQKFNFQCVAEIFSTNVADDTQSVFKKVLTDSLHNFFSANVTDGKHNLVRISIKFSQIDFS